MLVTLLLYVGLFAYLQRYFSRVCAVAQYAVLEANAKVNGRGPFLHPTPPKPLNRFRCHVKYITMTPENHTTEPKIMTLSHARTVVRECCNCDDESQWERGGI